ncbi:MAG: hypothetical protein ACD_57C00215G0001 [uncultured bacterium]|nr:MAG: hypothetical protein ACD_57C00215G0001 [uncultured bacterium]
MLTSKNIRTITDMRTDADGLLRFVTKTKEPVGILKNNKLEAYVVDPEVLENLEVFVEDFMDREMVHERLDNSRKSDFKDFENFWKRRHLAK